MELSNVDLLSLQTALMKSDPTTVAMCAALTPEYRLLAGEAGLCLIYSNIDNLSDAVLDELAWQFHIDWYDSKADLQTKRQTIKTSIQIHRTRGTPFAVEEVVKIFFGGNAVVEEWFEYGGDPYNFRVNTGGAIPSGDKLMQFYKQINSVKNVRSRLESVAIDRATPFESYVGMLVSFRDSVTINTEIPD